MKQKLFTLFLALIASVSAIFATPTEITVAKALEIGAALAEGAITDDTYYIVGYVTQIDDNSFNTTYKNMVFWIADENNGAATNAAGAFKVYRGKPTQELKVGDKVSVETKIQNYKGSIESVSSAPVNFLEESGTCGNNLTWNLNAETGVLTISGTGAMADYNSYSPWYDYRSSIKSVIINDSVTSIGSDAFYRCSSLTSVTIPNSVTSIGSDAFYRCSSLTSVTIPNSVTSIGNSAFNGCSSLTSVTIPNSVTSIGNSAFNGCSSLTSVTIPNSNSLTSIGDYAFSYCDSLTSVILTALSEEEFCKGQGNSLLYTAGVRCRREIQINGTKVTKFTIPNSVTSIGDDAFCYCSSLTSVTIPNSVTSIGGGTFSGCTSLTSITVPNSVTSIRISAFSRCTSLTSVTIPNSVTSIGRSAFHGCSSLTSVTIPNSVTSIGEYAFEGTGIYANEDNWENDVLCINDCLISAKDSISGAYTIKAGTRLIADYAFSNCDSLTSVTIPNSVTSIGDCAFDGCSSLTSITIPNSVISIGGYAFRGCSSLTSVTIGNSVTSIRQSAFSGCKSLTSVTIPNSVTSIGYYAFSGCSSLTSVTIGNSVTSIGNYAFSGCISLTSVINYATQPQYVESEFHGVDISACQLHVPSTSVDLYKTAKVWKDFGNIQPIRAEDITDVSETIITPSENEVEITWSAVSGAASYELVIKDKNGNIVCTLIFNANGQLTSIAFYAPSRNGVPAQTQNAGFSFTITGLDSGTGYDLTLTAKDNSGNIIEETTIPFHTNWAEDIENVQGDEVQSTKVIKDGQVFILRNGKTYTMQGQEVK